MFHQAAYVLNNAVYDLNIASDPCASQSGTALLPASRYILVYRIFKVSAAKPKFADK
jgi:hypothetical protein